MREDHESASGIDRISLFVFSVHLIERGCMDRKVTYPRKISRGERTFHIKRGRHSGFPPCCVRYFLFRCAYMPHWMMEALMNVKDVLRCGRHAGYVMCPRCVVFSSPVGVHFCGSWCHGEVGHCRGDDCIHCKAKKALARAYAGTNHL